MSVVVTYQVPEDKFFSSIAIAVIQIEAIVRYHFTYIRMTTIKRQEIIVGKDVGKLKLSYTASGSISAAAVKWFSNSSKC